MDRRNLPAKYPPQSPTRTTKNSTFELPGAFHCKNLEDSRLSLLVFGGRTLWTFVPADYVLHRILSLEQDFLATGKAESFFELQQRPDYTSAFDI
jgi:hypothetical protein